ncbi:MAG: hypothetical protein KatS3mg022_2512 [Armatimonadota bacterium]|nr:MAG: hypothetical protein KatS3mg022_2512 [Armatimonadota bacterium]
MRKVWLVVVAVLAVAVSAYAGTINAQLYADTAPNVYGSSNWAPWWTATKADVAADTFVNMRSGAHPGTTYFEPEEEIVYSTMDLGKRLHWIYWVPGKTTTELQQCNFQVNWMVDWEGVNYVYNWNNYDLEVANLVGGIPTNGWIQPSSWIDYDKDNDGNPDGVIGTFGFAWWATDDEAPPYDSNGKWWDEVNTDDVAALAAQVRQYQTHATGYIRWDCGQGWEYNLLQLNVVPEPGTMVLWLSGVAAPAFVLLRWRK